MAAHLAFSVFTDVAVSYFDPHSPWQRGTTQNTNGLLRQYLLRTLDFGTVTDHHLEAIVAELDVLTKGSAG